jgi:hypothetical protein
MKLCIGFKSANCCTRITDFGSRKVRGQHYASAVLLEVERISLNSLDMELGGQHRGNRNVQQGIESEPPGGSKLRCSTNWYDSSSESSVVYNVHTIKNKTHQSNTTLFQDKYHLM